MDINKYLVIAKGEDKTEKILNYNSDKQFVHINFYGSSKQYTYLRREFEFYKDPINVEIENNKLMLYNSFLYNVIKLLRFDKYYRVFFENGESIVARDCDLRLIKNEEVQKLSINKFDYYKEISRIVSIKTEDGTNLLAREYDNVNYIEKETALYKYLNPKDGIEKIDCNLDSIIFPFGANKSQFHAVRNAMCNQISIIEGPPGTGKTQTILNIIANIVKNGQTVAVVSNNNSATDNVYEKLQKYNLDYVCARLGKTENKDKFINSQNGRYPEFEEKLDDEYYINKELAELNQNISKIFELQNNIAKLKEELSELELQYRYFNKHNKKNSLSDAKLRNIDRLNSKIVMKLKVEFEDFQKASWWFKLKSQILYGIGDREFYKNSRANIINYYSRLFFVVKELELKRKIQDNIRKMQQIGNDKLDLLVSDSLKLFKEYLRTRYSLKTARKTFTYKDLNNNSKEFNKEYPIVFSTTYSIKKCLHQNYKFDYIIMDESSQVDLITGVLALSTAKKAVIVGDLKQLPNVITNENKNIVEEITKKYDIEKNYNYLENSFLSSIKNTIIDAPKTLLREHYRCHPKIIQFSNKKFYNDELVIMTEDNGEDDVLKAYRTSKGNHARGHVNYRQIDVVEKEIMTELAKEIEQSHIGIISPYRDQKRELEKRFDSQLKIDTVHKFQGREEDAIVITTVDNEIGEFVDDPRLLNVAVTRAKRYLRVVVSDNEKNIGTNTDDLIKYIDYNNFEVVESKTRSIYDLLYKANREERLKYLKDKKRISDYDSENLTYHLIDEVIKENGYGDLDVEVHVPLMEILANDELLTEEEKIYVNNVWTHIDFIIFNKMDKKLFLAIEVDGYFYHREGTRQQERDNIKDRILSKYDIPLRRFNTIGSGEKQILEEAIKEIFQK